MDESVKPSGLSRKGYMLPGELAAALMSDRHQLARPLVREILSGRRKLSLAMMSDITRLCIDLLEQRYEMQEEIDELERKVDLAKRFAQDLENHVDTSVMDLLGELTP